MNRATSTSLRVRWAGPAVLSVLIALAATPRTAIAMSAPPPIPVTATVTATAATMKLCWAEAAAYVQAWIDYIKAWEDYNNTLPGGTEQEIMDSARRLEAAANKVWETGWKLIQCLGQYL